VTKAQRRAFGNRGPAPQACNGLLAPGEAPHRFHKTRLCCYWRDGGGCRNGDRCRYAHGLDELRSPPRPAGPRAWAPARAPVERVQLSARPELDDAELRRRAARLERFGAAREHAPEAAPEFIPM
jgi:hypothetical protein